MNHQEMTKQVEVLIDKAGRADKADDALKFSQAACNAANAIATITHTEPWHCNSTLAEKKD
jgi:hypothetical protein